MRPPSKSFLEDLYARQHRVENLSPDPLVFARGFDDPGDGEVAGLVAAALAYGQVRKIMEAVARVLALLGPKPSQALARLGPLEMQEALDGFSYRFHKGVDVALFLWLTRQAMERHGRLREAFLHGDSGGGMGAALAAFAETVLSGDCRPVLRTRRLPPRHPVRHLLASPARGGAAKRLCLYLRWMARKDSLDPGYWYGSVDTSRLVVPLDTHVARVSRALGLTARTSTDWKTATQVTESLRRYDPGDPVRYDFSLFRFGMGRSPHARRGSAR